MNEWLLERWLAQEKVRERWLSCNYMPLTTQQSVWLNKYSLTHLADLHLKTLDGENVPAGKMYFPAIELQVALVVCVFWIFN